MIQRTNLTRPNSTLISGIGWGPTFNGVNVRMVGLPVSESNERKFLPFFAFYLSMRCVRSVRSVFWPLLALRSRGPLLEITEEYKVGKSFKGVSQGVVESPVQDEDSAVQELLTFCVGPCLSPGDSPETYMREKSEGETIDELDLAEEDKNYEDKEEKEEIPIVPVIIPFNQNPNENNDFRYHLRRDVIPVLDLCTSGATVELMAIIRDFVRTLVTAHDEKDYWQQALYFGGPEKCGMNLTIRLFKAFCQPSEIIECNKDSKNYTNEQLANCRLLIVTDVHILPGGLLANLSPLLKPTKKKGPAKSTRTLFKCQIIFISNHEIEEFNKVIEDFKYLNKIIRIKYPARLEDNFVLSDGDEKLTNELLTKFMPDIRNWALCAPKGLVQSLIENKSFLGRAAEFGAYAKFIESEFCEPTDKYKDTQFVSVGAIQEQIILYKARNDNHGMVSPPKNLNSIFYIGQTLSDVMKKEFNKDTPYRKKTSIREGTARPMGFYGIVLKNRLFPNGCPKDCVPFRKPEPPVAASAAFPDPFSFRDSSSSFSYREEPNILWYKDKCECLQMDTFLENSLQKRYRFFSENKKNNLSKRSGVIKKTGLIKTRLPSKQDPPGLSKKK